MKALQALRIDRPQQKVERCHACFLLGCLTTRVLLLLPPAFERARILLEPTAARILHEPPRPTGHEVVWTVDWQHGSHRRAIRPVGQGVEAATSLLRPTSQILCQLLHHFALLPDRRLPHIMPRWIQWCWQLELGLESREPLLSCSFVGDVHWRRRTRTQGGGQGRHRVARHRSNEREEVA